MNCVVSWVLRVGQFGGRKVKINSIDKDLRQLLNSAFYIIPRFQRPYSWDKENVQDFWNDAIANREEDYFIGSFVVYNHGRDRFGIVDGQQRITTITMLLCAIRDAFFENGFNDLAEGIHSLIERKDINNKLNFVLQTETSFPYFQEYIQTKEKPSIKADIRQEERNLEIAYKLIKKLITESVDSIKKDPSFIDERKKEEICAKLTSFRDSVISLKVIFVELDNEDDAYIIFETLNTRGKDLSASDLVKNLLTRFLRPQNDGIDRVKITWGQMLDVIENAPGEVSIDNYIQHYWLSKYEYTGAAKLYKLIRKRIARENASEFMIELEKQSHLYRMLFEPSYRKWTNQENSLRQSIESINMFHVRQPLPLLLAIINQYDNSILSLRETTGLVEEIENFIFKYTAIVTTQSTGGLSMMYSSWAIKINQIKNEKDKNMQIKAIKEKFKELSPSYDEYKVALEMILFTSSLTKQRKLVKYFLSKFHSLLNHGNTINYDIMTIEHIIPQSKIDGAKYSASIIGNLGNMILVSPDLNVKLDKKGFKEKKKIIKESGINLDPILDTAEEWNSDHISKRFDYLAKESYDNIWKI